MLFQGNYRIESNRMPSWNYAGKGSYHATFNTKEGIPWLGRIQTDVMELSLEGLIVVKELLKTPLIRCYVELDEWVVMPNHVHAIFHIDPSKIPDDEKKEDELEDGDEAARARLIKRSLGSMLGQIKSKCTKEIHACVNDAFEWQPRYHDRIIRSEKQLVNTRRYIENNIANWRT